MTLQYHIPVMPKESIGGLNIFPGNDVLDATFGGGGHSSLILDGLGEGRLFAFDQDEDAAVNTLEDKRLFFIRHNFRYIKNFLRFYNVFEVDSIFADLGVSSHDFDIPERGFSFRYDAGLDMRMNQNAKTDAASIINNYSEEQLKFVFRMYGEVKNAGRLVSEISKKRKVQKIKTTNQLKEIATVCAPRASQNKYLAQVFQALRIEVNDEMEALKDFLLASLELLKPGGRLVVITYHSLEDRICKNFMKAGNFEGKIEKDFYGNVITPFKLINRKVIVPGEKELEKNPRSRSAKLRIAEKY
ncbi:MAG: 16S rRNA (cytosine(1402)-N(4))-methyltransferase RsmH [Prolixibacteraceae bacterium]|jgi:16S rRNA (cytosine1402-N4)-methyltransferase|nr:16S rRNA (cytosine(1402)-N(4))-methyltransferase RsmH [Prolixibacteraceae bacterium]MBT6006048.1 16S rRNA (cytosine(1402)-N(4))-methyltransferase RsmH [Prolixibacteraceae bacterium]MBT6766764.1 16S rRNA (cytosine(1402)-N(4))-methyltransferase RsmH [Prolixibacteraceae bacterium]MBT6997460.1 16S rRNA (cytosine(1402)-N(4))-methyltransferase RsmH [Prolixibacteraceae bacterium]MBT7395572.1 16S rRNA (cytosine(1402)-N(4))-methyltransferase RsmH [Prolixibacteraceae bacterium]